MNARKNASFNVTNVIRFLIGIAFFIISLSIIAWILNDMYGTAISGTMLTLTLSIFAAMAYVEANRKYEQFEKERRINHIEKCMVNFYSPLRTMFDHEWNNYTTTLPTKKNMKLLEITYIWQKKKHVNYIKHILLPMTILKNYLHK